MPNSAITTAICPTCGCSLVRLGIPTSKACKRDYRGEQYVFCCEGCVSIFDESPDMALEETSGLVVCPSCLAEKIPAHTVEIEHSGKKVSFCRCPHCVTVFLENPDYYLERLAGRTGFSGIFSADQGCCGESEAMATKKEGPA